MNKDSRCRRGGLIYMRRRTDKSILIREQQPRVETLTFDIEAVRRGLSISGV